MALVKICVSLAAMALLVGCGGEAKPENWSEKYKKVQNKYSDMSEEEQLKALKKDWQYIHFMKHPSKRVQLAALEINPEAIADIDKPCHEAQMMAVEKLIDGESYSMTLARLLDKFDEKAQIAAVSKAPQIIKYIPYPSPKVQLAAIRKNPWVARTINNLTPQAKAEAIRLQPKLKEFLH